MKILLCGFMGAGKSTLLKKFMPNKLGFDCIDLDHAIAVDLNIRAERLGEWILENGFPLFRDKEKSKLKNLLKHQNSLVIAIGNGALNPQILEIIQNDSDCYLVFLDTDFETCLKRIVNDPTRPMAKIPISELRKLYDERLKDYLLSDLVISETEIKDIECLEALVHNLKNSTL
jgi:shikimate kinase